jgi:phosphoenolpyruvate synthase/pyruvate phosphate dikinase
LLQPDLRRSELVPLAALRSADRRRCGAKAANLGEIQSARLADVSVPDGFCIPFAAYADFMRANGLAERIARMRQQPGFATDAGIRRQALSALQAEIEQWPVSPAVADAWAQRWSGQLGSQGVFVRSSSSSEDLPNFSGAGLYTTVPNVRSGTDLAAAVRKVWASVYNFEAWEARQAAGIDDAQVMMSVFVQKAVDSSASGVMITRDPFDASHRYMSYIAAKRGIGIRVVEGRRVAEQILYSSRSKAVQVLNRSQDDVALQLDARGGVREVAVTAGRAVLSDALVQRLARAGAGIKQRFGGKDQDIEWAVQGDQLIILQARPFISAPGR